MIRIKTDQSSVKEFNLDKIRQFTTIQSEMKPNTQNE